MKSDKKNYQKAMEIWNQEMKNERRSIMLDIIHIKKQIELLKESLRIQKERYKLNIKRQNTE